MKKPKEEEIVFPQSWFRNTTQGERYLKHLCDLDDIEAGIDIPTPELPVYRPPEAQNCPKAGVWGFISSILP